MFRNLLNDTHMKKTVWLTYDLGVKGDYQNLYAWLDDHKAKECGNNLAYFHYDIDTKNDEDFVAHLREDLEKTINFQPGNRIYVVRKKSEEDNGSVGSFIIGKRKANPWEGYGKKNDTNQKDL